MHVPPNSLRSMIATFQPAATNRRANAGPDCPVPMIIASKLGMTDLRFMRFRMVTKPSTSLTGFSSVCQRNDAEAATVLATDAPRHSRSHPCIVHSLSHTLGCGLRHALCQSIALEILLAGDAHGDRVVLSI